jgi:hypothetical protein
MVEIVSDTVAALLMGCRDLCGGGVRHRGGRNLRRQLSSCASNERVRHPACPRCKAGQSDAPVLRKRAEWRWPGWQSDCAPLGTSRLGRTLTCHHDPLLLATVSLLSCSLIAGQFPSCPPRRESRSDGGAATNEEGRMQKESEIPITKAKPANEGTDIRASSFFRHFSASREVCRILRTRQEFAVANRDPRSSHSRDFPIP